MTARRRAGNAGRGSIDDAFAGVVELARPGARLSAGQRHGFSHRHLQGFAQRGEICIARPDPATLPVIYRHLGDAEPIRQLGYCEALDLPRLADLFT